MHRNRHRRIAGGRTSMPCGEVARVVAGAGGRLGVQPLHAQLGRELGRLVGVQLGHAQRAACLLREGLELLPSLIEDVARGGTEACARCDAREDRLRDACVARADLAGTDAAAISSSDAQSVSSMDSGLYRG